MSEVDEKGAAAGVFGGTRKRRGKKSKATKGGHGYRQRTPSSGQDQAAGEAVDGSTGKVRAIVYGSSSSSSGKGGAIVV